MERTIYYLIALYRRSFRVPIIEIIFNVIIKVFIRLTFFYYILSLKYIFLTFFYKKKFRSVGSMDSLKSGQISRLNEYLQIYL